MRTWTLIALLAAVAGCGPSTEPSAPPSSAGAAATTVVELEAFVGSASKPPTEEAAATFERTRGCRVLLHFGGSGAMLAQMKLAARGDLYFPGSSDFMEKAKRDGLVDPSTERRVVYLLPAINVPAGNPKGIRTLADLARDDVRVGIARTDTVCVGLYAEEVLRKAGLWDRVKPRIVTEVESCEKVAQIVGLGSVDAAMGWSVFQAWNPAKIQTVPLAPAQIARIAYIPVALSAFAKHKELALAFIEYLVSPEGQAIFRKHGYFVTEGEARALALPGTPVGGETTRPAAEGAQ